MLQTARAEKRARLHTLTARGNGARVAGTRTTVSELYARGGHFAVHNPLHAALVSKSYATSSTIDSLSTAVEPAATYFNQSAPVMLPSLAKQGLEHDGDACDDISSFQGLQPTLSRAPMAQTRQP